MARHDESFKLEVVQPVGVRRRKGIGFAIRAGPGASLGREVSATRRAGAAQEVQPLRRAVQAGRVAPGVARGTVLVLFDDVVEVLALTQFDARARVGIDALDGSRVGAALVDGDLLWHIVQSDGPMACSRKRRAAAWSRLARSRKSMVAPSRSTARYKYFHWPVTLMQASSMRQLKPTGHLRRRNAAVSTGRILIVHR